MFTWPDKPHWLRHGLWMLCLLAGGVLATPQRIVSLTPHITEQLFAIGAGAQVIAVDEASDWPLAVRNLPKVASYQSVNLERLLALQPDLVIVWDGYQQTLRDQLRQWQLPVLEMQSAHLDDLPTDLRRLGAVTGHRQQADALAASLEQRLARLRQQQRQQRPVRLFFQLWNPPLTTVARGGWIQDAIALCGGDNPFADSLVAYPQVDLERVLLQKPELILSVQGADSLQHWQQWPNLPAVQHQQLKTLQPDRLQRLTPRTLDGVEELCQRIAEARHVPPH